MHESIELLPCTPEINIIWYVNDDSILKSTNHINAVLLLWPSNYNPDQDVRYF